jgi:hypothetical protein
MASGFAKLMGEAAATSVDCLPEFPSQTSMFSSNAAPLYTAPGGMPCVVAVGDLAIV